MKNVVEGSSSNFDDIIKSEGIVVVDFWAPWCGPCKMQTPILEKIAESGEYNLTVVKINTDENPDLAQKMNISSIPTLIMYKGGQVIDTFIGLQPESVLADKIKTLS